MSVRFKNATSIHLDWEPVPQGYLHGTLVGYRVFWSSQDGNFTDQVQNDTLSFVIGGLEEYTKHCVSVLAFTQNGDGKISDCVNVVTDEDGRLGAHQESYDEHRAIALSFHDGLPGFRRSIHAASSVLPGLSFESIPLKQQNYVSLAGR